MLLRTQLSGCKLEIGIIFIMLIAIFLICNVRCKKHNTLSNNISFNIDNHAFIVEHFIKKRQLWNTSALGSMLFMNASIASLSPRKRKKTYLIHVWRTSTKGINLDGCSVKNCVFVNEQIYLPAADAVVVDMITGCMPRGVERNPKQKWIFMTTEPPTKTFMLAVKRPKLPDLNNLFNWSMSYRTDSDIPIPFGRTVALPTPTRLKVANLVPNWENKTRDVLASVLMSCCHYTRRMKFLERLKKHLKFDFYGKCSKQFNNTCPGSFRVDCEILNKYLFYLALENSRCPQYLTEKIFYNGYYKGAIPIIHGPSLADCEQLLPPNSYLHADNFKTVEALAKKIIEISKDDKKLLSFHDWRNHFEVLNEHGYFGLKPYRWCRVCEAMNYNDITPSAYTTENLRQVLDPNLLCKRYK